MERLLMNNEGIQALASQIGCMLDGSFYVPEECAEVLEELLALLNKDDKRTCRIRCQMHLAHILQQKLVPLLIALDEQDDIEDKAKLYSLTIRLMTNLTQPTECILPSYLCDETRYKNLVTEMNQFLAVGREAFLDGKAVTVLLKQMEKLLSQTQHMEIPIGECEILNNCLFLLRNLLFIHDLDYQADEGPRPYLILLGLLFQHGLTNVLMLVLKAAQREYWCIAAAQLVSLLYKDEVSALNSMRMDNLTDQDSDPKFPKRCTNHTCENSLSESRSASPESEEKIQISKRSCIGPENNPRSLNSSQFPQFGQGSPAGGGSEESSSQLTLQRASPFSPESSRCSLDQGAPQSASSSVSDDSSKQRCVLKLENEISLRLTQLQIREQLSIFTKCFLEEGFVSLVTAMRSILLDSQQGRLPDLYFMWVIGYFLNWALKLKMPFKFFKPCLSVDIVGFLVYIGVNSCEQLLLALEDRKDPGTAIRRNQLVVVALNRLFTAMDQLSEMDLAEEDREHLNHLHSALVRMREVKNFFVLMLRLYNPSAQSLEHLQDIITTNHKFLLIAEKVRSLNQDDEEFDMLQHIQSFSTATIMGQYCRLLENFSKNTTEVNDCIFTMMYHVAGDVNRPEVLLQLPILKIFTEISQTCVNLPRECNDVMNYMLQYFFNLASNDPYRCAEMLFGNLSGEGVEMDVADNYRADGQVEKDNREAWNNWLEAEKDILFSLYSEDSESPNLLHTIQDALAQDGYERTPNEIAVQLCLQNLWSPEQMKRLVTQSKINGEFENDATQDNSQDAAQDSDSAQKGFDSSRRSSFMQVDIDSSSSRDGKGDDSGPKLDRRESLGVEHLVGRMILKGKEGVIHWLQTVLLEACSVKLGGRFLQHKWIPEEPVILHYAIQNKSIPLVPYIEAEERALGSQELQEILRMMGFQSPQPGVLMWHRVPHTWTPLELITKARLLGPINMEAQKFTEHDLQKHIEQENEKHMELGGLIMSESGSPTLEGGNPGKLHFPGMHMSDLWHVFVKQCTLYNKKMLRN